MEKQEIYDVRIIYMETDSDGEELAFISHAYGVYRTKKTAIKKAKEAMKAKVANIKSIKSIVPKFNMERMTDKQLFEENYIDGVWFAQYYTEEHVSIEYYIYIATLDFYDE